MHEEANYEPVQGLFVDLVRADSALAQGQYSGSCGAGDVSEKPSSSSLFGCMVGRGLADKADDSSGDVDDNVVDGVVDDGDGDGDDGDDDDGDDGDDDDGDDGDGDGDDGDASRGIDVGVAGINEHFCSGIL